MNFLNTHFPRFPSVIVVFMCSFPRYSYHTRGPPLDRCLVAWLRCHGDSSCCHSNPIVVLSKATINNTNSRKKTSDTRGFNRDQAIPVQSGQRSLDVLIHKNLSSISFLPDGTGIYIQHSLSNQTDPSYLVVVGRHLWVDVLVCFMVSLACAWMSAFIHMNVMFKVNKISIHR